MKLLNFHSAFTLPKEGDTGHCNRSTLILGDYQMPEAWSWGDLAPILEELTCNQNWLDRQASQFELRIPSGILKGSIAFVYWGDDSNEGEVTLILNRCSWSGKIAGLLGGMSGFGGFRLGDTSHAIASGSLLPEGHPGTSWDIYRGLHGVKEKIFLGKEEYYSFGEPVSWELYEAMLAMVPMLPLMEQLGEMQNKVRHALRAFNNEPQKLEALEADEPGPEADDEYEIDETEAY